MLKEIARLFDIASSLIQRKSAKWLERIFQRTPKSSFLLGLPNPPSVVLLLSLMTSGQ